MGLFAATLILAKGERLYYNLGRFPGRIVQLVRTFGSHPKGHRFESCCDHKKTAQGQFFCEYSNNPYYQKVSYFHKNPVSSPNLSYNQPIMTTRTNEAWLADLRNTGEIHSDALNDLREIIQKGLPYALSRWLSSDDPLFQPLVEEVTQ